MKVRRRHGLPLDLLPCTSGDPKSVDAAAAEIAKAADAAALAAAAEINQRVFEARVGFRQPAKPRSMPQAFASMNNNYLALYGVNAVVMGINLDVGKHTVLAQVSANLGRFVSERGARSASFRE